MRAVGLEPTRPEGHENLNLARATNFATRAHLEVGLKVIDQMRNINPCRGIQTALVSGNSTLEQRHCTHPWTPNTWDNLGTYTDKPSEELAIDRRQNVKFQITLHRILANHPVDRVHVKSPASNALR